MVKLTLFQKIILKLQGHVFIGNRVKPGWSDSLPFTPSSAMSMDSSRATPTDTRKGLNAPSAILHTMSSNLLTSNEPIYWCLEIRR